MKISSARLRFFRFHTVFLFITLRVPRVRSTPGRNAFAWFFASCVCFTSELPSRPYENNEPTLILAALLCAAFTITLHAQTTAFTYQGRLTDTGGPASGTYDLQFTLYDADMGGSPVAGSVTNSPVAVANGLFTTTLHFGAGVFDGGDRWLEIGVRTNGSVDDFTVLSPRQPVTPTPYAFYAPSAETADNAVYVTGPVAASQLTGTISSNNIGSGAITSEMIADGAVGSSQLASDLTVNGTLTAEVFQGNGAGLTNLPGRGFTWQILTSGIAMAQANTGYVVTETRGPTRVTLPESPSAGDVVRVSDAGAAGWIIAQNADQSVLVGSVVSFMPGQTWTERGTARNWSSLASSADGSKLVAVVNGGYIYTSSDSGETWQERASLEPERDWSSVASSADGSKLVAAENGGRIYTSIDSGAGWTFRDANRNWTSVASSADGTKLVALVNGGYIYTSSNSGTNWVPRGSSRQWRAVASSSDGAKLVAVVDGGFIYTSTDSGETWIQRGDSLGWSCVASSSDGTKLVAGMDGGDIYTSTDSGVTWQRNRSTYGSWSIASSADGTKLVTADDGGFIYNSIDSGVSWTDRGNMQGDWSCVTSSADGSKLVAAERGGFIYTSTPRATIPSETTPGTLGSLVGGQGTGIELLYVGNNQFLVLSHEGNIFAY